MSIHKSLMKIQSELKAAKNQRNDFGKYNYRSCEDIVEAVKPLLHAEGLVLLISDEIINVGDHNYIEATATLNDGDNVIAVKGIAREAENRKGMDDSQITGATSSYARKYALNGLFAIDDTKDADTMKPVKEERQPVKKEVKKDWIKEIKTAKDEFGLQHIFKEAWENTEGKERDDIKAEYDKKKVEITELGGSSQAQR